MFENREVETAAPALEALRRRPTKLQGLLRFFRTKPLGSAGALIISGMIFMAVLAPVLAPYDPYQQSTENLFRSPSKEFILGTDNFGRDLLSRIIWGARLSLYVGLLATMFGTTVGAFFGLIGGYWGGNVDTFIQRVMDVMMSFPMLVLALSIVAVLGASITNVIIAISFPIIPRAARIVRSSALSVRETQYVDAATAIGCLPWRIILVHILPNCTAPYIVLATAQLGTAILVEASLSFLGLGVPPPTPSWGAMLTGAASMYAETAPWMAVFPGLAITLAVFGFNLLGDSLRDVLDPRLRGR